MSWIEIFTEYAEFFGGGRHGLLAPPPYDPPLTGSITGDTNPIRCDASFGPYSTCTSVLDIYPFMYFYESLNILE